MEIICGVDEAGRGPLAGPVYAAAVILPVDHGIVGLRDSKKLSAPRRQQLAAEIRLKALCFAVCRAEVDEVDRLNILQATLLAMQRAVSNLSLQPTLALIDGNRAPKLNCQVRTMIGGDDLEPSISAASILAKTERDAYLRTIDVLYPKYGFAQHKGYGTSAHLSALRTFGPCPEHRRSFLPVQQSLFEQSVEPLNGADSERNTI